MIDTLKGLVEKWRDEIKLRAYHHELLARAEAAEKDAERYRFLRDAGGPDLCVRGEEESSGSGYEKYYFREMIFGQALHKAIDAALARPPRRHNRGTP